MNPDAAKSTNVGVAATLKDLSDFPDDMQQSFREKQPDGNFAVLQLNNDSFYVLRKDNPRYRGWAQLIADSEPQDPVYVEAEPGTLVVKSLLAPLPRVVENITEERKEGRLAVTLFLSPAIYYLNENLGAEKFSTFYDLLAKSLRTQTQVLITSRPVTMEIIDVRTLGGASCEDDEGYPPADENDSGGSANHSGPGPVIGAGDQGAARSLAITAAPSGGVTMAVARAQFQNLADQPQIPFGYIADCCTARAHEMCRIMQLAGLAPRKIWNYGHGFAHNQATLRVNSPSAPNGLVTWIYHVSPILRVVSSGTAEDIVLDPSLFDDVATIDEWVEIQHDATSLKRKEDAEFFWFDYRDDSFVPDPGYRLTKAQLRHHRAQLNEANN